MMSSALAKQDFKPLELANVMDMNGKINVRLGLKQIQPFIRIYHREKERLDWFVEKHPDFSRPKIISRNTFMTQLISIEKIHSTLEDTLPYLDYTYHISKKAFDYCDSRLSHPNLPYTPYELKLVREIISMMSGNNITRRLKRLEHYDSNNR